MYATFPAHSLHLHMISLITFSEHYKCLSPHYVILSSLLLLPHTTPQFSDLSIPFWFDTRTYTHTYIDINIYMCGLFIHVVYRLQVYRHRAYVFFSFFFSRVNSLWWLTCLMMRHDAIKLLS